MPDLGLVGQDIGTQNSLKPEYYDEESFSLVKDVVLQRQNVLVRLSARAALRKESTVCSRSHRVKLSMSKASFHNNLRYRVSPKMSTKAEGFRCQIQDHPYLHLRLVARRTRLHGTLFTVWILKPLQS